MSHTPDPKDLKKTVKKVKNVNTEDIESDIVKEVHKVTDAVGDTAKVAGNTIQAAAHHVQDVAHSSLEKIADAARGIAGQVIGGLAKVSADMADKATEIQKEVSR